MDIKYFLFLLAFFGRLPVVEFKKVGGGLFKSSSGTRNTNYGRNQNYGSSAGSRSSYGSASGGKFSGLLRGGNTRNILMGAAGGFAAYQVGKGLYRMGRNSAMMQMYGRPYYFGDRYYNRPSNRRICSAPLSGNDFGQFQYEDGGRIETVYFECDMYREECCGWDCCYRSGGNVQWWHIILILVIIGGMALCVMYVCMRFVRKSAGGVGGFMKSFRGGQNRNRNDEYQMPPQAEQQPYPTPFPAQQPPPYYPGAYAGGAPDPYGGAPGPYGGPPPAQPYMGYPQKTY